MNTQVIDADKAAAIKRAKHAAYMREYYRRRSAADPEYKSAVLKKVKKWSDENPKKRKSITKKYDEANREKNRERVTAYREQNREKDRKSKRDYNRKNPDKVLANCRKRQARLLNATPKWANEFFIQEAYHIAKVRQKVLGGNWHVDHIVPLQSKVVCGLHVEHNLAVVRSQTNQSKGNRWWPNMPETDY